MKKKTETCSDVAMPEGTITYWENKPWSIAKVLNEINFRCYMFSIRLELHWWYRCGQFNNWLHCKRGHHRFSYPKSITHYSYKTDGKKGRSKKTQWLECATCNSKFFTSERDKKIYLELKGESDKLIGRLVGEISKGAKKKVKK